MSPSVKLAWGAGIVVGVTAYMAYVGASASWKYYVTADECVARAAHLAGSRVRVSGGVAAGSLRMAADRSQASFALQGATDRLNVVCSGPLPDNLAENMDVVVEGQLEAGGRLRGDKLLTRCASKYESQEPVAAPQGVGDRRGRQAGTTPGDLRSEAAAGSGDPRRTAEVGAS